MNDEKPLTCKTKAYYCMSCKGFKSNEQEP